MAENLTFSVIFVLQIYYLTRIDICDTAGDKSPPYRG